MRMSPYSTFQVLIDHGLCVSYIELVHDQDPIDTNLWHRWYNVVLETSGPDQSTGLQTITCTMSEDLFARYKQEHFCTFHVMHRYQPLQESKS